MAKTIISSNKGFYAILDYTKPTKDILAVGYLPGKSIYTPAYHIVVQPSDMLVYGQEVWDGIVEPIRTPLEALLQTIYGAGASLTSTSKKFSLHLDIVENSLEDQYESVEVVDFMAFCGALKRYQTLADGSQIDLLMLGPGDTRPNINDLVFSNSFDLMYDIIDLIGIEGMYPYLYAKDGIDFAVLSDRIKAWIPDLSERQTWVYNTMIPLLRELRAPVLSQSQILSITS